jgi:hypothetical protein
MPEASGETVSRHFLSGRKHLVDFKRSEEIYLVICDQLKMTPIPNSESERPSVLQFLSMLKKIFKIIGLIVIVLFALNVFFRYPFWWDDATLNDSDLQVSIGEPIPERENAATYIPIQSELPEGEARLLSNIPAYRDGAFYRGDTKVSNSELQKYISDSTPLVSSFEEASKQSAYQCPLSFGQFNPSTPSCKLGTVRQLGVLTLLHAKYYEQIGQIERSVQLVDATLQMGRLVTIQLFGPEIIEGLVGIALTKISLEHIEASVVLKNYYKQKLSKYRLADDVFTIMMKHEYQMFKESLYNTSPYQSLAGRGTYLMQPNQTFNLLAEITRQTSNTISTPCNQTSDKTKLDGLLLDLQNTMSPLGFVKQNFLGRVFVSTVAADLSSLRDSRCDINTQIEALSSN